MQVKIFFKNKCFLKAVTWCRNEFQDLFLICLKCLFHCSQTHNFQFRLRVLSVCKIDFP